MTERAYAEINLKRLAENYRKVCHSASPSKVMCVLKANAYGHGAVRCAETLASSGANSFCVATITEALEIRRVVDGEILILGYVPLDMIKTAVENDVSLSVYSSEYARTVRTVLRGCGKRLKIHVAVNTAMNRIGIPFDDIDAYMEICSYPEFEICGIYSHFLDAENISSPYTPLQAERFSFFISHAIGLDTSEILTKPHCRKMSFHLSNSAAADLCGGLGYTYVRSGISLYGFGCGASPVMRLFARVIQINRLHAGDVVGYGASYVAACDVDIATLAIGYADGMFRSYTGGTVLIRGVPCRIIGRICMDQMMVELPSDLTVSCGDYAEIFDADAKNTLKLAAEAKTICYEQFTAIKRVPLIYV